MEGKLRRSESVDRYPLGDALDYSQIPSAIALLAKTNEALLFSNTIEKYDREMICTTQEIILTDRNIHVVKQPSNPEKPIGRSMMIDKIVGVSLSPFLDNFVVLHFTSSYQSDFVFSCDYKTEFIDALQWAHNELTKSDLSLSISDIIPYSTKQTLFKSAVTQHLRFKTGPEFKVQSIMLENKYVDISVPFPTLNRQTSRRDVGSNRNVNQLGNNQDLSQSGSHNNLNKNVGIDKPQASTRSANKLPNLNFPTTPRLNVPDDNDYNNSASRSKHTDNEVRHEDAPQQIKRVVSNVRNDEGSNSSKSNKNLLGADLNAPAEKFVKRVSRSKDSDLPSYDSKGNLIVRSRPKSNIKNTNNAGDGQDLSNVRRVKSINRPYSDEEKDSQNEVPVKSSKKMIPDTNTPPVTCRKAIVPSSGHSIPIMEAPTPCAPAPPPAPIAIMIKPLGNPFASVMGDIAKRRIEAEPDLKKGSSKNSNVKPAKVEVEDLSSANFAKNPFTAMNKGKSSSTMNVAIRATASDEEAEWA